MTTIQALSDVVDLKAQNGFFEKRIVSMIDELDVYLKQSR
jgi:hypothetical protein